MSRPLMLVFFFGPLLVVTACLASPRPCFTPDEALDHAGKEICLTAHVYDVVESPDGARYLDVCPPETPEGGCRFAIVSMPEDRKEVGTLDTLREQDVHLRGVVRALHGESIMLLSNARQLRDGPEKFRPNPQLLNGFSAGSNAMAFKDPAMTAHKQRPASLFRGSATAGSTTAATDTTSAH